MMHFVPGSRNEAGNAGLNLGIGKGNDKRKTYIAFNSCDY